MFDASFFDKPFDRRGTDCRKWDDRAVMDEGGIPLWVADSDFECAPAIRDALVARAMHPAYGYTLIPDETVDAVRAFWLRRHGVKVQREDIVWLPSVVSGLRAAVLTMTAPSDRVALLTPVYGPFYAAVRESGRTLVDLPMAKDTDGRYHIPFDRLESEMRGGLRLLMLCSPHNPVSRVWTREELERICALCRTYGTRLAVDEIHADYSYETPFTAILTVDNAPEDAVSMSAPSKTFNVAGLKQAFLFCRDIKTRAALQTMLDTHGVESANIFALTALKAAYTSCDEWLDGMLRYLSDSRKTVTDTLSALLPLARVTPIEATYLAWTDISAYESDHDALARRLREEKVALTDGVFFGPETGRGHMRVNFACPKTMLTQGLERFAKAVKNNQSTR